MSKYPGRMVESGRFAGMSLGHPDIKYVAIANGFGIEAEAISDPADLGPALRRAKQVINGGRPYLLDVKIETRFGSFDPDWFDYFSIAKGWPPHSAE
jgi:thiamine pyrophosphate-dependent acetolactate synthase large subunit-like protein